MLLLLGSNLVMREDGEHESVPGGGWVARHERGAWDEAQRGALPQAIAARHRVGTRDRRDCATR